MAGGKLVYVPAGVSRGMIGTPGDLEAQLVVVT